MKMEEMKDYENMSNGGLNWILWHLVMDIPEGHATICVNDYCSDWNATMPLAVKHGVSLMMGDDPIVYHACSRGFSVIMQNPLRAIVICLIRVLEAEQCQSS